MPSPAFHKEHQFTFFRVRGYLLLIVDCRCFTICRRLVADIAMLLQRCWYTLLGWFISKSQFWVSLWCRCWTICERVWWAFISWSVVRKDLLAASSIWFVSLIKLLCHNLSKALETSKNTIPVTIFLEHPLYMFNIYSTPSRLGTLLNAVFWILSVYPQAIKCVFSSLANYSLGYFVHCRRQASCSTVL